MRKRKRKSKKDCVMPVRFRNILSSHSGESVMWTGRNDQSETTHTSFKLQEEFDELMPSQRHGTIRSKFQFVDQRRSGAERRPATRQRSKKAAIS